MSERSQFFERLRRSLGREGETAAPPPAPESALSRDANEVRERTDRIRQHAEDNADALADKVASAAEAAGWRVFRAPTREDAARYVADLARDIEARTVVRSAHSAVESLGIERALEGGGIEVRTMALDDGDDAEREEQRRENRESMIGAAMGLTGVDYAIAETGSATGSQPAGVAAAAGARRHSGARPGAAQPRRAVRPAA